ncbi:LacI family DNA-binding transcriptional regulator [Galactobacter sp.]|uniref:LacI family DNA-binding transcriptional regulator n=1 Tax=Galactobacter sp. TaxID=2676125 RepID=UPI0025C15B53|nr:LacI family DNA-binding transcriptional regulator [Galactobacter sp.]
MSATAASPHAATLQSKSTPTIKDVAAAAGVSVSTVSHAFSGARPISAATKDKVRSVATRLGYVPNAHARQLRLGRSGLVGLVVRPQFAFSGPFDTAETFNRLIGSITTETARRGMGMVHVADLAGKGYALPAMDGCIVAHPYEHDETIVLLERARIPFVLADPDPARADIPWVAKVNYGGGLKAVLDSVSTDGRPVVLMPGTEQNAWNVDAVKTYSDWCGTMGQEPRIFTLSEGLDPDDVRRTIVSNLRGVQGPLGLVYADSSMTLTVLDAAKQLGRSVPGDLFLAALTDTEHDRASSPTVTAMDLRHEELATAAVSMLMDRLGGAEPPADPAIVEPKLTLRQSTQL